MILVVCLLLTGCMTGERFALYDPYMVSPGLLTSARLWYKQNIDFQAPKIQKYGELPVYWDKAWITQTKDSNLLLVVPTEDYEVQNENFTFKRFVLFTISNTRAEDGKIIELLGQHYNVDDNYRFLIANYDRSQIAGFDGTIQLYDVSYRKIKSTTYKEGNKAKNISFNFINIPASQMKKFMKTSVTKKTDDVRKD